MTHNVNISIAILTSTKKYLVWYLPGTFVDGYPTVKLTERCAFRVCTVPSLYSICSLTVLYGTVWPTVCDNGCVEWWT